MDSQLYSSLGMVAGILTIVEYGYYALTIVQGKTRPSRTTWFIWALLTVLLALSYDASGGEQTVWVAYAAAVGTTIVALLSIRFGVGGWNTIDKVAIVGTLLCLPLWFLAGPAWVLYLALTIDIFGILPTIVKTYSQPNTESGIAWGMNVISSILNMAALGALATWGFNEALYPIYMLAVNGTIFLLIIRNRSLSQSLRF